MVIAHNGFYVCPVASSEYVLGKLEKAVPEAGAFKSPLRVNSGSLQLTNYLSFASSSRYEHH